MKYLKFIGIFLLLVIIGLSIFIFTTHGKKEIFYPGPDFEYAGLNNVKSVNYTKYRNYISLKDGNKIAVTYLIPKNKTETKFPAILSYSPYTGSLVVPNMSWKDRLGSKYYIGKWGPAYEGMSFYKINT